MRINGVDPRVIEHVQQQNTQPVVRELKETKETRVTREYKDQERDQGQSGDSRDRLKKSIENLNKAYESFSNPVRFSLVEDEEEAKVDVIDTVEDRVIKRVDPEEVMSAVTQVEKLLGLLVDTLI